MRRPRSSSWPERLDVAQRRLRVAAPPAAAAPRLPLRTREQSPIFRRCWRAGARSALGGQRRRREEPRLFDRGRGAGDGVWHRLHRRHANGSGASGLPFRPWCPGHRADAEGRVRSGRDRAVSGRPVLRDRTRRTLANITDAVPGEQDEAIVSTEGHIFCEVYPSGASGRIERFVWRNDPKPRTSGSSTCHAGSIRRRPRRPTRSNARSGGFPA